MTVPACGENVNAFTSRPFRDMRRSADAGRLTKKRRLTAQPTEVRTTIGLLRLLAANVPGFPPGRLKLAETARGWFISTWQVTCVPEHAPPQPRKTEPDAGVAIRVTIVPSLKAFEQSCVLTPQEIPGPLTRPAPATETFRIFC